MSFKFLFRKSKAGKYFFRLPVVVAFFLAKSGHAFFKCGIAIYIAAEQPEGVPEENWLPINREDIEIGPIMRLYEPDLERFTVWEAPSAEKSD